jgi:hypothetical protein
MIISHPKTRLWTTSETSRGSNIRSTMDDVQSNSGEHHLLLSPETELTYVGFNSLKLANIYIYITHLFKTETS